MLTVHIKIICTDDKKRRSPLYLNKSQVTASSASTAMKTPATLDLSSRWDLFGFPDHNNFPPQCVRTAGGYGSHCGQRAGQYQIYGELLSFTHMEQSRDLPNKDSLDDPFNYFLLCSVHADRGNLCSGGDRINCILLPLCRPSLHDAGLNIIVSINPQPSSLHNFLTWIFKKCLFGAGEQQEDLHQLQEEHPLCPHHCHYSW